MTICYCDKKQINIIQFFMCVCSVYIDGEFISSYGESSLGIHSAILPHGSTATLTML